MSFLAALGGVLKQLELVTGARVWDFQDRQTGKSVKGAKIAHTTGTPSAQENHFGLDVTESMVPIHLAESLRQQLPAICEVTYEARQGKKTIELHPVDVRVVAPIELAAVQLLGATQAA